MIREATQEEIEGMNLTQTEGMTVRAWVTDEDGITGHIALSEGLGQVFGHDTRYWGEDKTGAARLWLRARREAKEMGHNSVIVHCPPGDPMTPFWLKHGFVPVCVILRGDI